MEAVRVLDHDFIGDGHRGSFRTGHSSGRNRAALLRRRGALKGLSMGVRKAGVWNPKPAVGILICTNCLKLLMSLQGELRDGVPGNRHFASIHMGMETGRRNEHPR